MRRLNAIILDPDTCPGIDGQERTVNGVRNRFYCGRAPTGGGVATAEPVADVMACARLRATKPGSWASLYDTTSGLCHFYSNGGTSGAPTLSSPNAITIVYQG